MHRLCIGIVLNSLRLFKYTKRERERECDWKTNKDLGFGTRHGRTERPTRRTKYADNKRHSKDKHSLEHHVASLIPSEHLCSKVLCLCAQKKQQAQWKSAYQRKWRVCHYAGDSKDAAFPLRGLCLVLGIGTARSTTSTSPFIRRSDCLV